MARLGETVEKIRTKNAGPFWLTIEIFCGNSSVFKTVSEKLATEKVARLYGADVKALKRFDIDTLNVVKFSMPRPVVQGSRLDRDMHGAAWSVLLEEMTLD